MLDESSKANYQPWRQEEFSADIRVRKMTSLCRWIYKTLLQEAWVCSTRPYLPADDEQLWMLSDCDSLEQWLENKSVVLRMFEQIEVGGVSLLLHKRIQADWDHLVEIREAKSGAGRKSGEKRRNKSEHMLNICSSPVEQNRTDVEQVKESKSKEKEKLKESESTEPAEDGGQENEPMKATKQIPILCQTILGVSSRLYPEQVSMIQLLEAEHKGSAVINAFTEWALEHRYDELRNPVSEFLKEAEDLLGGRIASKPAKDPEITNLARELTYISGGVVHFTDKHKVRLVDQIADGFTPAEIIAAFREVFEAADKDAVKYIAKNFVETADQIVYASRKRKLDDEKQSNFLAQESARLEREAAEERERRRNLPENQIEETLGM